MTQIAIYGAGGFAREVACLIESCRKAGSPYETACFIDDDEAHHGRLVNGIPVLGLDQARAEFPDAQVVGGVGSPAIRQQLMEKAEAAGVAFATVVHPQTQHSPWVEIGEGAVICAGNILTVNIEIGRHVQINLACTVGHDAILGDYATLAPGVHVSGCVHIGKRAYIGTGANIINGTVEKPLVIGEDAVVGAGACVVRSVEPGQTVIGVPARPR